LSSTSWKRLQNVDDPKVKADIAAQVTPLIEDIANAVERDAYRQRLARLLKVDERTLVGGSFGQARRKPRIAWREDAQSAKPPLRGAEPRHLKEAYVLGVLLRRPDLIYRIDRSLQEGGLARLGPTDFQRTEFKTILVLIQEALDQDDQEPLHFVMNRLDMTLMDTADDLLARTAKLDPNDDKVLEDLLSRLLDLRRFELNQNIEYNRYLMQEAQEAGDLMAKQYQQSVMQYTIIRNLIDQALGRYTNRSLQSQRGKGTP
jgi:DNA primase